MTIGTLYLTSLQTFVDKPSFVTRFSASRFFHYISFDYNHHEQALKNLKAGTTYHYRVISEGAQGNRSLSDDYMFTTLNDEYAQMANYVPQFCTDL